MYFGYSLTLQPHALGDICYSKNWHFHVCDDTYMFGRMMKLHEGYYQPPKGNSSMEGP